MNFEVKNGNFYKNGMIHHIYSGTIHYFRIVKEYWYDRLLKLKNVGLNTVETYIPWNTIEKAPGVFDFNNINDFISFIDIAKKLDLDVILRPGPYICAERDLGGLPFWLLKEDDIVLRSNNPKYMFYVERYLSEISKLIKPRLFENGGNIIMIQIENEYGSYGNDKEYLNQIYEIYKKSDINALFFTSDGATFDYLKSGNIKDKFLPTVNFGSHIKENYLEFRKYDKDSPFMVSELWLGWFDTWHEKHHTRDADDAIKQIKDVIDLGGSFNIYMFAGGTNFELSNGSTFNEDENRFVYQTSSYDYYGFISEDGSLKESYYKLKELLENKTGIKHNYQISNPKILKYDDIKPISSAKLLDNLNVLSKRIDSILPLSFEELDQNIGYVLYRTKNRFYNNDISIRLEDVHDRATVLIDGIKYGIIESIDKDKEIPIDIFKKEITIDSLVENLGRCNYEHLNKFKGFGGIKFYRSRLMNYENYPINLKLLDKVNFDRCDNSSNVPTFYKYNLKVEEPHDTFINPKCFNEGIAIINGFIVGRYYNKDDSPVKTLYVPSPLLNKGDNEIIIFETDSALDATLSFEDHPIYNE